MQVRILVADDDRGVLASLQYLLRTENYQVLCADSPADAIDALNTQAINLALIDLNYRQDTTSGQEGLGLLQRIKQLAPELPVVVMTAWGSVDNAVAALKSGAADFIQKPWENEHLLSIISNQLQHSQTQQRNRELREEVRLLKDRQEPVLQEAVAASEAMQGLLQQLKQAAGTDASILLTGENGTGKSLLAYLVHQHSSRAELPFISVNMGSITENLFESEMFGHVKGAFTDARETRIGRFELAGSGSLFLDEIGNTPISQQAKLLRVLEEKQFEKVGSSRSLEADCRLLTATNCDLGSAVSEGRFRMDLLYRLNTLTFRVPALRERIADIVPLAHLFLGKFSAKYGKEVSGFSRSASQALLGYDWPGNIRELSHVVERAVILGNGIEVNVCDLGLGQNPEIPGSSALLLDGSMDEIEQHTIMARMAQYKGNVAAAARSLGMSRSAFYRRLERFGLNK